MTCLKFRSSSYLFYDLFYGSCKLQNIFGKLSKCTILFLKADKYTSNCKSLFLNMLCTLQEYCQMKLILCFVQMVASIVVLNAKLLSCIWRSLREKREPSYTSSPCGGGGGGWQQDISCSSHD